MDGRPGMWFAHGTEHNLAVMNNDLGLPVMTCMNFTDILRG